MNSTDDDYHPMPSSLHAERQPIRLKMFGGFQAIGSDGREIVFPTRKARLLLAHLANPPGRPHTRARLTDLLWGDRGEEQARGSLRNALSVIRKHLGARAIITDGDFVLLAPGAISIDVSDFELCLTERTARTLQAAVDLYRGDLLEGVTASEIPFQEWLMVEQTRLRDLALGAVLELLDLQAATADYVEAISTARQALAIDPVCEDIHRMLMRLYAAAGQRGLALRQYQFCRDELWARLGVEPEDETVQLLEQVRTHATDAFRADFEPDRRAAAAATPDLVAPQAIAPEMARSDEERSLPLPSDRPSIAVLPFKNLGGEPDEESLAEGLAEDITAGLSRFRWLFVIARDPAFTYKERSVSAREAARDLGVRYVVSGSIRRIGKRIRVATDLIDATTGATVWAEHYDGVIDDIFELQDEISTTIVCALEPELGDAELRRARRKRPEELDSWSHYQRGLGQVHLFTEAGLAEARRMFRLASEQDPSFAGAFAELGYVNILRILLGFSPDPAADLEAASDAAQTAIALDSRDSAGHFTRGRVFLFRHDYERALDEFAQALSCNPNSARAHYGIGCGLVYAGRPADAIPEIERAIRLSSRDPNLWGYQMIMCRSLFNLARYDEAVAWARKAMQQPNSLFWPYAHVAAALGHLGRAAEGKTMIDTLLRLKPDFDSDLLRRTVGQYGKHSHVEEIIDGLRLAGLKS